MIYVENEILKKNFQYFTVFFTQTKKPRHQNIEPRSPNYLNGVAVSGIHRFVSLSNYFLVSVGDTLFCGVSHATYKNFQMCKM